ncbi:MAG: iron-containing alcohol dehydrogenase [bacterium]|nr:iron-containing alcohol dehydrogenase [bacterium]
MTLVDHRPTPRLIFGADAIDSLGAVARDYGFRRTLLVADQGLVAAGHVDAASRRLEGAGIRVHPFHDFSENPDTSMVEAGCQFAGPLEIDSIVGLGGGSSMDCAKAVNLLLTNGGRVQDYWGWAKAARPMLPMIGVPTTTGTGSEAQSYALISDAETHVKMACGDPKAAFRCAILDPRLAASQPPGVRATTGYDAISHAVETFVTTKRNPVSDCFAREAWCLLEAAFERCLAYPDDLEAVEKMQLGAWFAGCAIENSMLGATHACANPLTTRCGAAHGVAIALLLPHVVRWNSPVVGDRYRELHPNLSGRLGVLAHAAGLPRRLREVNVAEEQLTLLADEASKQWTGRFNPRPFDASAALEIYKCAY